MSKTQYVILGLLSEGSLTGYEIKKIIDIRFSFFWSESYGQIYPELKRMVKDGLIAAAGPDQNTKRKRVAYSITQEGLQTLKGWLSAPTEKETVRFELLLKMYFSRLTDAGTMKRHVEEFMSAHQQQLAVLNQFQKELEALGDDHYNHRDILRIIDFGRRVYTAYLEWCKETIEYLERRDSK